jgi:uncharacterized protein YlxW (UPF0749 family)
LIEQFIIEHFGDIVLFLVGAYCMYLAHKQEREIVKKLEDDRAKFKAEREAYHKKRAKVSAENMARLKELTDKIEARNPSVRPPAC